MHGERIAKGHPDAVRHDLGRVAVVPDQNRELVAADASQRVTFPQTPLQSLAHRTKQLVASGVPEPVVDLLEIVDIDVDQHKFTVPHRILEPLREQDPVGQSGQWVVVDLMSESALHLIQPLGQQPLRANRDHLPGRGEENHQHRRGDQDRVQLVAKRYVEGEQHRDAEEATVGQDQLRPVHSVFVATAYRRGGNSSTANASNSGPRTNPIPPHSSPPSTPTLRK